MCKDNLIKEMEMNCPFCNEVHIVEKRKRLTQSVVNNEIVNYEEIYYLCRITDEEENEFIPAGLLDDNLLRARDSYRIEKGILTSQEIRDIRNIYGLSQRDFSALLGWGDVTVTRYESKKIQDETYDNIMRMVFENPMFALENIDKHKNRFSKEKYLKIRENILKRVGELGNIYLKKQEINSIYIQFQEENEYNGYKILNLNKLANVIGYFAHFIPNLYKVKLMKILWYTDALYFKRQGKSMTGLVYKHMPYGALPLAHNEIIYLQTVKIDEEIAYESTIYKIIPNQDINISKFSLNELNVLETVASKFKHYNTNQIVDYMHNEIAYKNTELYKMISYNLAKDLNNFQ